MRRDCCGQRRLQAGRRMGEPSPARVRNHAKLARNRVAAWLEGNGALPEGADGNHPIATVNKVISEGLVLPEVRRVSQRRSTT